MKKTIGMLLAVIMLCSLLAIPASATAATYANTQVFCAAMDELGFSYTCLGIDPDDNIEHVRMVMTADEGYDYTVNYFFTEDNETISVRIWDVITYKEGDFSKVLRAVNDINYGYKFVTFYCDETDNTVTVSMDMIVREGAAVAEVAIEGSMHIMNILEEVYSTLSVYSV